MKTKVNVPRSGIAWSGLLQGLILAAGAQVAIAGPTALPSEAGLLKLSNVKIQNATPQQVAAAEKQSASSKSAVRAFKDKDSGKLREQTPEEMVEEGVASAAAPPQQPVAVFDGPAGSVGALLDEAFMANAVARKDASGKLHMECVTGHNAAKTLANGKVMKEHNHDR